MIYLIGNENWTITFGIDDDHFIYIDSSATHNIVSCSNNIWYHIRLDFECGLGAYEGLSADHFYIYINGERYGEYEFRWLSNKIDYMDIYVWQTSVVYYYDAIAFSWDPDYTIGDNMNEGLLLSYDNTTTLDWQGYSLDRQVNRTILGNTITNRFLTWKVTGKLTRFKVSKELVSLGLQTRTKKTNMITNTIPNMIPTDKLTTYNNNTNNNNNNNNIIN